MDQTVRRTYPLCHVADPLRDPAVVLLVQRDARQGVIDVGVEPCNETDKRTHGQENNRERTHKTAGSVDGNQEIRKHVNAGRGDGGWGGGLEGVNEKQTWLEKKTARLGRVAIGPWPGHDPRP